MKIAMITAGGAGMFCGSCMQDNTLVRALRLGGADAVLIPTYTPIRVDETNVSSERVFLGGVNVYLDSVLPGWGRLPSFLTGWLNHPGLIRVISRISSSTDASQLGRLTIDLLSGSEGPQHREIQELIDFLCDDQRPELILFSNALLSGIVPELRRRFRGPLLTILQGDDIFLDALKPRYRTRAIELISRNCAHFDGILTHSEYYTQFMGQYLSLPRQKFRQIPLTLEHVPADELLRKGTITSWNSAVSGSQAADFHIGYFARICPEKGVHRLLEAAIRVLPDVPQARVLVAGFLSEQHRKWFQRLLAGAQRIVGPDRILWLGSPDTRKEKFRILRSFDLLCVPTEYHEPKGLYVLEAALCGVPSLVPDHGAFPERIRELGCGEVYSATDPLSLEYALARLSSLAPSHRLSSGNLDNDLPQSRQSMRQVVMDLHGMSATADKMMTLLRSFGGAAT